VTAGSAAATTGSAASAVGLAVGFGLDRLLADPPHHHPVAGFGQLAASFEQRVYRDSRLAGVAYAGVLVGAAGLLGALTTSAARGPFALAGVTAAAAWAVVGGTSLRREATGLAALLQAGDLAGARARLPNLCGRDPAALDAAGLARASVESVAENTVDAVVGPLLWGAVAGVPGLLAYRAVNTLDAMVGHRNDRYLRFGWASARADDLVNLLPARVTAALTVALAPVVGGRSRAALRAWRRDGGKHPSPNAGPAEAAFAGALGRTLGGRLSYAGRIEDRPLLGDGPPPDGDDIARAARLSAVVSVAAGAFAVGLRLIRDRRWT